jgi:aspartate aminotransferase-like enzyme
MEAVARQFATGEHVMVIRNGWFSFRWTELFDMGGDNSIPRSHTVLKAQPQKPTDASSNHHVQYAPHDIEQVVRRIRDERPAVLFAPHVETSTGMMLSDDYIKAAAAAMREIGGLFVLDCIASGTVWVDMKELGVDVVISAPQKGWTGPACAALVMMSERAVARMPHTQETSFSSESQTMDGNHGHVRKGRIRYHTTMPTDALRDFHEISVETIRFGIPQLKEGQIALGKAARDALEARGLTSVAAPGFQAPGVLVFVLSHQYRKPGHLESIQATRIANRHGCPMAH